MFRETVEKKAASVVWTFCREIRKAKALPTHMKGMDFARIGMDEGPDFRFENRRTPGNDALDGSNCVSIGELFNDGLVVYYRAKAAVSIAKGENQKVLVDFATGKVTPELGFYVRSSSDQ